MDGGGGASGGGGAYGDTPGEPGTESQLAEPRDLGGGGGIGLRGSFTIGGSGRSSSTALLDMPVSWARARASSCAWARRSAVCSAITRCRSAVRRHFSHMQLRYLQYRLCPFSSILRRWLRQRAQFGGARGTAELEAPGSERSSQSSGTRRLHPLTDTMAALSCSAVFAGNRHDQGDRHATQRAVTMRLLAAPPRRARPAPRPPHHATTFITAHASMQFLANYFYHVFIFTRRASSLINLALVNYHILRRYGLILYVEKIPSGYEIHLQHNQS